MTKSYVTMEQKICPVCANVFDTGGLLLDKRLRERFDMKTVVGLGRCPECEKLFKEGFIALIGIDESKSTTNGELIKLEDAHRTGEILHVKKAAFEHIFTVEIPKDKMMFITQEAVEKIKIINENITEG